MPGRAHGRRGEQSLGDLEQVAFGAMEQGALGRAGGGHPEGGCGQDGLFLMPVLVNGRTTDRLANSASLRAAALVLRRASFAQTFAVCRRQDKRHCAETEPETSSRTGRRCGEQRRA